MPTPLACRLLASYRRTKARHTAVKCAATPKRSTPRIEDVGAAEHDVTPRRNPKAGPPEPQSIQVKTPNSRSRSMAVAAHTGAHSSHYQRGAVMLAKRCNTHTHQHTHASAHIPEAPSAFEVITIHGLGTATTIGSTQMPSRRRIIVGAHAVSGE